jgi:malate/lactate dehydrogenase
VIELKLNAAENKLLQKSAKAVKEVIDVFEKMKLA